MVSQNKTFYCHFRDCIEENVCSGQPLLLFPLTYKQQQLLQQLASTLLPPGNREGAGDMDDLGDDDEEEKDSDDNSQNIQTASLSPLPLLTTAAPLAFLARHFFSLILHWLSTSSVSSPALPAIIVTFVIISSSVTSSCSFCHHPLTAIIKIISLQFQNFHLQGCWSNNSS